MDKPFVTVILKPLFADFLRYLFKCNNKEITISNTNYLGKFISSRVSISNYPVKQSFNGIPGEKIKLIIPVTRGNKHFIHNHFLYIKKWELEQINQAIEYEFKKEIELIFESGYDLGEKQNDIVDYILEKFNIRYCEINKQTIKKYDYRKRRKRRKIMLLRNEMLRNQAI